MSHTAIVHYYSIWGDVKPLLELPMNPGREEAREDICSKWSLGLRVEFVIITPRFPTVPTNTYRDEFEDLKILTKAARYVGTRNCPICCEIRLNTRLGDQHA